MIMKNNFNYDTISSKNFEKFLDENFYFKSKTQESNFYNFERNKDKFADYRGIDLTMNKGSKVYNVDEKVALYYTKRDAPISTFSFELAYFKQGVFTEGWLTNSQKQTDYYILVWAHEKQNQDIIKGETSQFDVAEIMIINRNKLLKCLDSEYGIDMNKLNEISTYYNRINKENGNVELLNRQYPEMNINNQFRLFSSTDLNEKPLNLLIYRSLLSQIADEIYYAVTAESKVFRLSKKHYSPNLNWNEIKKLLKNT